LKQKSAEGPTDGVVDLTTSAATTTRTVIMTHSKDSSFDRISLDEKIKQHKSMIETLQQLKAKGIYIPCRKTLKFLHSQRWKK